MSDYMAIYPYIQSDDVILTVNNRLATYYHQRYFDYQYSLGRAAFETPYISKFSNWIANLWLDSVCKLYTHPPTLLTPSQAALVWKGLISENTHFIDPYTIEQQAINAWNLCHQWKISYHSDEFQQFTEHHTWQSWAIAFHQKCQENHWIDRASLIKELLLQENQLTQLSLPKNIFLIGFDGLPPQYEQFIQCLAQQGCHIHSDLANSFLHSIEKPASLNKSKTWRKKKLPPPAIYHLALMDTETELYRMAQWAYQAWQQGCHSVGCVIKELTALRPRVEAIFQEVYLGLFKHSIEGMDAPFSIAGGVPFIRHPIIRILVDILTLEMEIEFSQGSRLIRSPYIGQAEREKLPRMKLDAILRQSSETTLTLPKLIQLSRQQACPELSLLLTRYYHRYRLPKPTQQIPSQWACYFSELLHAVGWPGERALSSEEFQWMSRWSRLLDEFAQLDLVLPPIEIRLALHYLIEMASDTLFQPKSPIQTHPIQIMGILDAAGLNFDQMWVMGLNDTTWPSPAEPNPFIPYHLQRTHQMPHASHARQHHFAQSITQRLAHSASTVIFSSPMYQEDQPVNPSPLILNASFPVKSITLTELALPEYSSPIAQIADQIKLESFHEIHAPPCTTPMTIKGGFHFLKLQSDCSFKAFAAYRLMVRQKSLRLPSAGLTPLERGQLAHSSLEAIWRVLGTQARLQQYTDEALDQCLTQIIQTVLEQASKRRPQLWKPKFRSLETRRLHRLIKRWLIFEKTRPPFQVIALEHKQTYTIADITSHIRIDRIDQLETGEKMLLDYKTSALLSCQNWFGERLSEPQLPLYGLSEQLLPHALSYAQLTSKQPGKFYGLSAKEFDIKGILPIGKFFNEAGAHTWDALLDYWRKLLHRLAEQFKQSEVQVNPRNPNTTCRHCDYALLCRIRATSTQSS